MPEQQSSFTRGIFAGVVLDSLLFPYPRRLDEHNPDEARTVRRLIKGLRDMEGTLIDSARFDEQEMIPDDVIRALAELGMLGLTIPKKYGGLELSSAAYARVFETLSTVDAGVASSRSGRVPTGARTAATKAACSSGSPGRSRGRITTALSGTSTSSRPRP